MTRRRCAHASMRRQQGRAKTSIMRCVLYNPRQAFYAMSPLQETSCSLVFALSALCLSDSVSLSLFPPYLISSSSCWHTRSSNHPGRCMFRTQASERRQCSRQGQNVQWWTPFIHLTSDGNRPLNVNASAGKQANRHETPP